MVKGFQERLEDVRVFLEQKTAIGPAKKKYGVKPPRGQEKGERDTATTTTGTNTKDIIRIDRFRNVFAKPLEMVVDFVAPVHPKTENQRKKLHAALKDNFVFMNLDKKSRNDLVEAMEAIDVPQNHVLIKQGDLGDYFYFLESGSVTFNVDGKDVGTAEDGACFGELALLYDCPRAATVTCNTDCCLWRVNQTVVRRIKAARALENNKEARDCVNMVSFLKDLDQENKNRIADALERKFFKKSELLVKKGDCCEAFFIIKHGAVKATDISMGDTRFDDVILKEGDFFGQSFIQENKPWPGNARATSDGLAYWLSRENFNTLLGGLELDALIAKSRRKRILQAIPIFANSDLDPLELDLLAELVKEEEFKKGHIFTREGKAIAHPAIYSLVEGTISITKRYGGPARTLKEKNELFGHDELVPEEGDKNQTVIAKHTITATEHVVLGVLTLEEIVSVIMDPSRLGKKIARRRARDDSDIKLETLERFKILGAGTFGQVWLVCEGEKKNAGSKIMGAIVQQKSSSHKGKTPYALKIQYKRDLIGYNQVEGVLNEKKILEAMDHPFVMRLINSYKDTLRVYMLTNLLQGGELSSVIHTDEYDGVPEDEARFYGAGILEGLSYMHRRNIIHRDLKGENVLMDSDGYAVLIDLGFAKEIKDKTFTCCGTPIFMAPEVLLGEGHNQGADYWSLGVMIYDMIVGYTPFYVPGMTQVELYERIVRAKVKFPSDLEVSPEAKNLIRNLLFPDPSFRLGSLTRGDLDIRDHAWFMDIDFGKLFRKELEAPWVPNIKDPFDVSQFDDWSDLEKKTRDRAPLTAKEQKLFESF